MTPPDLALDREARRLAQQEFERPLLIEAGAGTGKTATLVNRVLAWCLDLGWEKAASKIDDRPADVLDTRHDNERIASLVLRGTVAITFTEAASSEMAERVLRGFQQVKNAQTPVGFAPAFEVLPLHRERAGFLLACAEQLQIRTIHAFCRKLLAEHPFEARLHPNFNVDGDGSRVQEIVEDVIEDSLAEAYDQPGDEDFLFLAERGYGPREIADVLIPLTTSGTPMIALAPRFYEPTRLRSVLDRLADLTDRLRTLLEVRRPNRRRAPNAHAILRGLDRLRQRLRLYEERLPTMADVHRWLDRHFPSNLIDHLGVWARGEAANQTEQERLGPVLDKLQPLARAFRDLERHLRQLDPPFLASASRVLETLLRRVRREMRLRGVVCFADLLRAARDLLQRHPGVRFRLRHRLDQLLVDEFQDTDALQCDLIRDLALSGSQEQRPGLFVVGDPKQSIYGWRNADLEAYEAFANSLIEAGGWQRPLIENFRSAPEILNEVEHAIAPVMQRRAGLQPAFHALEPCAHHLESAFRPPDRPTARQRSAVEYWISWTHSADDPGRPAEASAVQTARLEASLLARDLLALRREADVAWSEVAILLRSFTDLEIYLAALREAAVPFNVSRDRQYYRRREIIDACALVRAVLAPEDTIALLTFLRSSAVGVPDAALIPLWQADLPQRLAALSGPPETQTDALKEIARIAHEVALNPSPDVPGLDQLQGWQFNLIHAAHCLADLRHSFETLPVDRFIDRLRTLTFFEGSESTRYLGNHRLANLDRFFHELFLQLEENGGDRHRILRRLRNLIRQGTEAEEARPNDMGDDAVRILTIHQAKGLEFPHVYLLQTHKEAGRRYRSSFEIGTWKGQFEGRLFGVPSVDFDLLEHQRLRVSRAELVRTLYVAMTRAEKRLVLVGRRPLSRKKPDLDRADTHAELLLHRRGPSTDDLAKQWQEQQVTASRDGVTWYFGGLDTTPVEPYAETLDIELPSIEQLAAEQEALRAARQQAAEEMARPFRSTASQDLDLPAAETRETVLEEDPDELPQENEKDAERKRLAILAGRAIHRVLETMDLEAEPLAENERQRQSLAAVLHALGPESEAEKALPRTRRLLETVLNGRLLKRLRALGDDLLARELPILLPPSGQTIGYLSGVVDLVYRDETGQIVIADFKTSSHFLPEPLRKKHFAQVEVYRQAVELALHLDRPARVEIWYLASDHIASRTFSNDSQTNTHLK